VLAESTDSAIIKWPETAKKIEELVDKRDSFINLKDIASLVPLLKDDSLSVGKNPKVGTFSEFFFKLT